MSQQMPVRKIDRITWEPGTSVLSLADIGNMIGKLEVERGMPHDKVKSLIRTNSFTARVIVEAAILKMLRQPKG